MRLLDELKKALQPNDGIYNEIVNRVAELRGLELDIEIIRTKLKKLEGSEDEIDRKLAKELTRLLADKEKKAERLRQTLSAIRALLEKEGL